MPVGENRATIAIIEGDEDLSALIQTVLAGERVAFATAASGKTGLEIMRARHPDVLVLDLSLPDMNGWELYMQLQSNNGHQPVPVIILADQASRIDRNFGIQVARVHDFLVKPFLPSQLRESVQQALQLPAPIEFHNPVTHAAA